MLSTTLLASHIMGGSLTYSWVSSSAATSTYKVKLTLLADPYGASLAPQEYVYLKSTDGSFSDTLTLSMVGTTQNNSTGCVTAITANFQANVVLPKNRVIKMFYRVCCRPSGTSGLVNSGSQSLYIEALIDGLALGQRGYDNSAQPEQTWPYGVITGKESFIPAFWTEQDGDSVHVSLRHSMSWNSSLGVPVPANYSSGFTWRQPVPTAGGPDSLRPYMQSQLFRLVPNTVGGSTVALQYTNYLWDSTTSSYRATGYVQSEFPIYIFASTNYPLNYSILANTVPHLIKFKTSGPHYTATFSGEEFALKSVLGQTIPGAIDSVHFLDAKMGNFVNLYTDPNLLPGNYELQVAKGADSNSLVGYCSNALMPGTKSVNLPFAPAQISALWGGTGTGFYELQNAGTVDSVTWSATGAILSQAGTTFGAQFTTTNLNPVWLSMSQPSGELRALRHGAGGATSLTTFALASGIGTDEPRLPQARVYPNPTSGKVSLVTDLVGTYELFSVFGALLERGAIPSELDLGSYPQGVYLLTLTGDGRRETLRVVRN